MTHSFTRPLRGITSVLLILLLLSAGCTEIRLISEYDEETDRATTELHKQVEKLLLGIEKQSGSVQEAYEESEPLLEEILIDLRALQLRAVSRTDNELQVEQFGELEEQVLLFQEALAEGISPAEIPVFRSGFNQTFRAILTLELAKKRGE